ncbi:MAG: hypothetical protein RL203_298 [Pseudomonadota bacterium]
MTRSDIQTMETTHNQFGLRIVAHLDAAVADLPHDISERLRAARTRAVAARAMSMQTSPQTVVQNGLALLNGGDEGLNIWNRIGSLLPLIALVAGLATIKNFVDDDRANQLAEVDAALLADDLPPSAYADPGFLQFLKLPTLTEKQE